MSWLSKGLKKVGHALEHNPITEGSKKILKGAEKWIASKVPHTTQAEKRQAMEAAKEQIDYYKGAKEELVNTRKDAEEKKATERNAIAEKEIRGRKRTYTRAGFMQEPATSPVEKLG